jgi:site-specific DNA-methyltransferase (adenine-specific)
MQPPTHQGGDLQGGPQSADAGGLPRNTILIGDVRERLAELPAASVDTIITSPPYFGVRDYGHEQQLGAEPDVNGWVAGLRDIARELGRVLRPTGSLWLNLGDGFSRRPPEGAPTKSLLLGPSRVALALVKDGWWLFSGARDSSGGLGLCVWAAQRPMGEL